MVLDSSIEEEAKIVIRHAPIQRTPRNALRPMNLRR
jgi:hypothetical protein